MVIKLKKAIIPALILLLCFSLAGCAKGGNEPRLNTPTNNKAEITALVEDFGSRLEKVALLAPDDLVKKSLQENYGDLVSPLLLAEWISSPQDAPGRVVSSPWPDRIEILDIEKLAQDSYRVKGEIIEITSAEQESGGVAAKRPVTLETERIENRWRISAVQLGEYLGNSVIIYKNTQYGFDFVLPDSWNGYSLITGAWEGYAPDGQQTGQTVESGPLISIRHPLWTAENKRQDIPIMVFTLDQWEAERKGNFHIGAAPVGPSELGRNTRYVFALPARYNYVFPAGYEEVERILQSNALSASEEYQKK